MRMLIIGARKCGTTSLQFYLESILGHDVIRHEQLFTRHDGVRYWKKHYPDRTPVVILRNPLQRIESDYSYTPYGGTSNRDRNFIDYLMEKNYSGRWGDRNPISQSNYLKWLSNWRDTPLIIFNLHAVQKNKGFPVQNQTKDKMTLTKDQRDLAQKLLRNDITQWKSLSR